MQRENVSLVKMAIHDMLGIFLVSAYCLIPGTFNSRFFMQYYLVTIASQGQGEWLQVFKS